ncbi:tRNA pseudouridine(55) synthase TruB [Alkaliphilus transvaalensis]|uniref:tRNA pseudouridine(55) synthase TruB n=1 Tax=Alkaliphilus transvaalensis TaxID=114628 RepID=UPI00047A6A1A|nr:tRNA pseudouridine(55) synthase TruB [Alkaliphilus transvaalensis]
MNGIINILKPPGMTSHDVVSLVRRKANMKKVGHTGTLDPNAAGVLPICLGQGTKVSQFLLDSNKKYRAELTLGIETDTQDRYGTILCEKAVSSSREEIAQVIMGFVGEYDQIPPMYSALKRDGKKLYELAREGIEIEREPRRIKIHDINILKIEGNKVLFDVTCSKGTYIRTLCKDIGDQLGCGGMMSFLLRTATGNFHLSTAITIDELKDHDRLEEALYPVDYPLDEIPKVVVKSTGAKAALNGNRVYSKDWKEGLQLEEAMQVRVYVEDRFIGLALIKVEGHFRYLKFLRLFV